MNKTWLFSVCITVSGLMSCNEGSQTKEETPAAPTATEVPASTPIAAATFAGNYVNADYAKRGEGYDWVAVLVKPLTDSTMHVAVRSRVDKKKPTCTFDAEAARVESNKYLSKVEGKLITYTFVNNTMVIAAASSEDEGVLQYYCSGGGSFGGTYTKTEDPLDKTQLDQRVFTKTLVMNGIGFDVSTTGKGSMQQLTVQPFGLKKDNSKITMEIDGSVTGAEIGDLNVEAIERKS
jgi:hypothetical protein